MPAGLLRTRMLRAAIVSVCAAALLVPAYGSTASATVATESAHAAHLAHLAQIAATSVGTRTASSTATRLITIAASQAGKPYRYGASGPDSFDCSGFTSWVFRHIGVSLPHNAAAQYASVRHVAKSQLRLGDLVFMYGGGGIYHVAIYAGNGQMWAATHTGDVIRKERIYSSSYLVGRAF